MLSKKPNILFTRSLSDNEQNIAKSNGLEVRIVPFIKPSTNYDKQSVLKEILSLSDRIDAFAFTSQNAVKALLPLFSEPQFYSLLKAKMVFATGKKTTQTLDTQGIRLTGPLSNDAESLGNLIKKNGSVKMVVYFKGNLSLDILKTVLNNSNIEVIEKSVYYTSLISKKIKDVGVFDGIVFYSPSAVNSFFRSNQLDKNMPVFCIGTTTGIYLKKMIPNEIIQPSEPESELLINRIRNYFYEEKIQE